MPARVLLNCFANRVSLAKGADLSDADLALLDPKAVAELVGLGCLEFVAGSAAPTPGAGAEVSGEAEAPASGPSDHEVVHGGGKGRHKKARG